LQVAGAKGDEMEGAVGGNEQKLHDRMEFGLFRTGGVSGVMA
jgi:hypothetical protein